MLATLEQEGLTSSEQQMLQELAQAIQNGSIGTTLRSITFSAVGAAVAPVIASAVGIGAAAGTVVPLIGTAVGAALGLAYSALFGKRDDFERLSWEEQNNISSPLAGRIVQSLSQVMSDAQLGQLVQVIRRRAPEYLSQYTQDWNAEQEYIRILVQDRSQIRVQGEMDTWNKAELQFVISIFFHGVLTSLDRGDIRLGQDKVRMAAGMAFLASCIREVTGASLPSTVLPPNSSPSSPTLPRTPSPNQSSVMMYAIPALVFGLAMMNWKKR